MKARLTFAAALVLAPLVAGLARVGAATGTLAGYGVSAVSSGVRFQLNSPGLLPVGDATTGNVVEADLPFTRTSVSSGPIVDALGSPLYPGDVASNAGSAISQFGGPPLPNYPAVAQADYPPAPGDQSHESFAAPGVQASSQAGPTGGSVNVSDGEVSLGPGGLVQIEGSRVANQVAVGSSRVEASASSTVAGLTIAGIVRVASVEGSASASSEGSSGAPVAALRIGHVTVGGQDAYIDQSGVHLASQDAGGPAANYAGSLLASLAAQGVSVRTIAPTETSEGGQAQADSGALEISISGRTPGVPGAPPLAPGLPPLPGATSVPLVVNLLIGNADASAQSSIAPMITAGGAPPAQAPSQQGASAVASQAGPEPAPPNLPAGAYPVLSLAPTSRTVPPTGPGSSLRAAATDVSMQVPAGIVLSGLLAAAAMAVAMLGAARWQLLSRETG